ncbi:copper sensory histidine kinase cpxA [Vibrio sp. JCM 19236]|nr:copper sensory histidine kinase cpxA [Vibrio sp. JCM 19236]
MNLPKFSSLYGRIFAIFWITVLAVLIAVIAIQKSDPRKSHSVSKESLVKINRLVHLVEKDLNKSKNVGARLKSLNVTRFGNKDFRLYLADSEGNVLSLERGFKRRALQAMASELADATEPSKNSLTISWWPVLSRLSYTASPTLCMLALTANCHRHFYIEYWMHPLLS